MLMPPHNTPLKTYKSYRAEKFNKYTERQKALIVGVGESSLKPEDKKILLCTMIDIISKTLNKEV